MRKFSVVGPRLGLLVVSFAAVVSNVGAAVLEEVVVTAQKREQAVQDVSISVTAFSGDALRELNMANSVDIAAQTPGLNIGTPVGEGNNPSITLRGVGLNDFNDNNEGPVAVYRDEVYQAGIPGLTFQLFDLERVEVLRGPQGTLYGRNATGGLVHYISKRPSDTVESHADLSLGSNAQVKFDGAIGGALSDSLQARFSIATNRYDGYVTNRAPGKQDGNEGNSLAWRGQLQWDDGGEFTARLSLHGSSADTVAPKYQHQVTEGGVASLSGEATDIFGYRDTDNDNFAGEYDRDGVLDIENTGVALHLRWGFNDMELVSITAMEQVDKLHREDTDVGPFNAIEPDFVADVSQLSQELRLSGEAGNGRWVAGLYYFDSEVDNQLDLRVRWLNSLLVLVDSLSEDDGGFGSLLEDVGGLNVAVLSASPTEFSPLLHYDVSYLQETESTALFGQYEYRFNNRWALTAGLRFTQEKRSMNYVNAYGDQDGDGTIEGAEDGYLASGLSQVGGPGFTPTTSWLTYQADIDNDNVSGKLVLDYQPNDSWLLFASFSQGFKSGGFNGGFLDFSDGITPSDAPYQEESLTAFELGFKATLVDDTLRLNASLFNYDYKDYQALTFSGLSQFITNADATLSGLDFELVWLPSDALDIAVGASFLSTKVDEVFRRNTEGMLESAAKDTDLVLAPELSLNGVVRYQFTPTWSAQIDFNHQGEHYFDITNSAVSKEDAYTVFNARVGWQLDENWEFSAWVKNLSDEEYRVYTFDFSGPAALNQQFYAPPRWFGLSARYSL